MPFRRNRNIKRSLSFLHFFSPATLIVHVVAVIMTVIMIMNIKAKEKGNRHVLLLVHGRDNHRHARRRELDTDGQFCVPRTSRLILFSRFFLSLAPRPQNQIRANFTSSWPPGVRRIRPTGKPKKKKKKKSQRRGGARRPGVRRMLVSAPQRAGRVPVCRGRDVEVRLVGADLFRAGFHRGALRRRRDLQRVVWLPEVVACGPLAPVLRVPRRRPGPVRRPADRAGRQHAGGPFAKRWPHPPPSSPFPATKGDILFGTSFAVMAQVCLYVVSQKLCVALNRYTDGMFFGTGCNLLGAFQIYFPAERSKTTGVFWWLFL
ncbi:MAG: LOW QUALITY PROTEIN: hypothetical protein BJ554DRAFT_786 [Olpidium bornovanus]|uniref:Chitin synthase export chaperone n=1 Tax=Olpidium bornovanus TaxID=278681 RepID=A0A8H8DHM5_9FUNG|nr:MAG: LOW QUALITY PROTEIN: hypothetical protein BJ554DRAFT_786 [Olpidium bornovanus]